MKLIKDETKNGNIKHKKKKTLQSRRFSDTYSMLVHFCSMYFKANVSKDRLTTYAIHYRELDVSSVGNYLFLILPDERPLLETSNSILLLR